MATIEDAEAKWARKSKAAADKWATNVASADALEAYIKRVAEFTEESEKTVSASIAVSEYKEFQKKASNYKDKWVSRIEDAAKAKKWSSRYKEAFTTPAK